MNLRVILAIILLVMSCIQKAHANEYESPVYTRYASEVTSTFLKEVYKEYGFECGASGGEMPHDVEIISVQLSANRNATIDEARELEVKLTESFAEIINGYEKIRPFLREYPFPSYRARVAIRFIKEKAKDSKKSDYIDFVFQGKNRIFYRAKNPENRYVYIPIKEESYEEARKIVLEKEGKKAAHKETQL